MATNDDVYTYRLHLQEQDSKKQRTTQISRVNVPYSLSKGYIVLVVVFCSSTARSSTSRAGPSRST